jgi:hypothetical protein
MLESYNCFATQACGMCNLKGDTWKCESNSITPFIAGGMPACASRKTL